MSIPGAVIELNKEIERLTKIRDSLLQGSTETDQSVSKPVVSLKRKYVRSARTLIKNSVPRKTSLAAKKPDSVKAAPSVRKREISAATRKKMSDAAKARVAAKSAAVK